ncbi:hypothetical protein VB834_27520 [Limnoraphis robusta Tam1]|uniref:Uncharacterized protein n=1 Tax=Limnoraphis robusta CCNP1315 TaxID=3110306 RepID=A0ABU5TUB8_9CYAN|nr:hypothetical protein [Limnoraphis robusta]MEA5518292.1 hypothetical protein [Limnoraphis robusta CCNP1315]MEA5542784.1 hypothetical protein [Limnoraphis robusta Tam1]MEA5545648.1 hypothetical protein [Limnoraphis robusta CCNP1324]
MNQTTGTLESSTETSNNISDVSEQSFESFNSRGEGRRSQGEESTLPENLNFCGTVTTEEFPEDFNEEFNLERIIASIRYLQNLSEELGSEFSPIFFQPPDFPADFNTSDQGLGFTKTQNFSDFFTDFLSSDSNFSESINFQDLLEQFSQLERSELPEEFENIDFSQLPEIPEDLEDFPTIIDDDTVDELSEEETSDELESDDDTVDELSEEETSDELESDDDTVDELSEEETSDELESDDDTVDELSDIELPELPEDLEDFPTIIDDVELPDEELPDGEVFNNPVECFPVDMMEEYFSQSQEDNSSEIPDFPINFEPGDINDIEGEVTILPFPLPGFSEEFDSLTGSFNGEFPTFSETDSEGEVTILPFPLPEGWGEKFDQLIGSSEGEFPSLSETDGEIIELPFEYSFTSWVEGGEMPEIMHCFFENDQVMFSAKIPLTQEDLTPTI